MYEELAPHALDFARRLTEILPPADREAFNRAVKQLTERSAQLVAEVGAGGRVNRHSGAPRPAFARWASYGGYEFADPPTLAMRATEGLSSPKRRSA